MSSAGRRAYLTAVRAHSETPAGFVENSFVLSIGDVVGKNSPHQGSMRIIVVRPPKAGAFPVEQPIEAHTDLWDRTRAYLRLSFEADGVGVDQHVQLTCTEPPFRWWFVCPSMNIRAAKLYLPPGARQFASRKAHGLIYRCQVEPRRHMQLSPDAVRLLRRVRRQRGGRVLIRSGGS